jgi:hypothetical protein
MSAVMDDALSDYYKLNIQLVVKRSGSAAKPQAQ